MRKSKISITVISAITLFACSNSTTYEEKVDAFNAIAQAEYDACIKTLKPNEQGGFASLHGDGYCGYSNQLKGADNKTCSAQFRRKIRFASGGQQSCEPYHKVEDSSGILVIKAHLIGYKAVITTVATKNVKKDQIWVGDILCGNHTKAERFFNVTLEPYLFSQPKRQERLPVWRNFGWIAKTEKGTQIDFRNLQNFRGHRNCQIFWRYPNNAKLLKEIRLRLGY